MWLVKVAAAVTGYIVASNIVYAAVTYVENKSNELVDSVRK